MGLVAYADESGHSADPKARHMGLSAIIAPEAAWTELTDRWKNALMESSVPHFHMSEFAHSLGPFTGWSEEQRRSLLAKLVDALVAAKPSIFGAVLKLEAWRALAPEDAALFVDPWDPCLQECAFFAAAHGATVGQATVDFVFSQQPEFEGKVRQLWELLRKRPFPMTALGECRFDDMRREVRLQVADLVVYEVVLAHDQVARGATKFRYPFERIRSCDTYFRYIDEITLRTQIAGARGEFLIPVHPEFYDGAV
jgi:hypothetical protein